MPTPVPILPTDSEELLKLLRHKQGTWVQWGQACQMLQKMGENSLAIFENTGFEPIQQNQIVVAAQVYASLQAGQAADIVLAHYEQKGSDILHELRVLNQSDRVTMATFALEKNLDVLETKDVVKALKEAAVMANLPEGFTRHPGDAVVLQVMKAAQGKLEPQERTRLIARGLRFAHSETARAMVEKLLMDMANPIKKKVPNLPNFRYDGEDDIPRILPVAGNLPLSVEQFKAVPQVQELAPFGLVQAKGVETWATLPGWMVVHAAEDGVVIATNTDTLRGLINQEVLSAVRDRAEDILILVDRAQKQWDENSYFAIAGADGDLQFAWFDTEPQTELLGKITLTLRPKRYFDEAASRDQWQLE
ncbi:MAG: RuBisCO accumulation factor 1 [Pseudanabaenaceae cyanobacterium bins.39]|nr:RuBisCO accumulation factor 1 [Pseudanabaenaceae cyanobacterium bins.39]